VASSTGRAGEPLIETGVPQEAQNRESSVRRTPQFLQNTREY
jgi:hypothetical protein